MKLQLLAFFSLFISSTSFAQDILEGYSKIEIRPVYYTAKNNGAAISVMHLLEGTYITEDGVHYEEYNPDGETTHLGIIRTKKEPLKFGLYGVIENDVKFDSEKYSYDLLGEVEVSLVSGGITINLGVIEKDAYFTFNRTNGSELNEVCGKYYGLKGGAGLMGFGLSGFSSINREGIILRSSTDVTSFLKFDLSGVEIKVRCLDESNPNWNKILQF